MLTVHDDSADAEQLAHECVPPVRKPGPVLKQEEAIASEVKKISFALFQSMTDVLEDKDEVVLTREQCEAWMHNCRQLNILTSAYARSAVARVDRLQVELELSNAEMSCDLLDRESMHTNTLEVLARIGEVGTSAGRAAAERVGKAMQLIHNQSDELREVAQESPLFYFDAVAARKLVDESAP